MTRCKKGLKATGRLLVNLQCQLVWLSIFAKQAYDEGKSIPEIMAAPFLLDRVRSTRSIVMSPEETSSTELREDFSGNSDFDTPTLEGVDEVDIEEVLKRVGRKMADEVDEEKNEK